MELVFEIVKIEEDSFLLKSEDGQELVWPKSKAPEGLRLGSRLNFLISDEEISLAKRRQRAKDILNEVLNV